jgi:ribokinase
VPVRAGSILVVGSTMIDLIAFADRLPEAGETVVGVSFLQGFGGKGANQAVMAARFGVPVAMVAAVGDDPNGAAIVANLREQGIATDDVAVVRATSGVAPIWVDGAGMNRIIIIPGANELVSPETAAAAVDRVGPAVVIGQLEIPQPATAAAFAAARRTGATTILNPAPGAVIEDGLVAATDWLVPNETEFVAVGGRPLQGDEEAEDAAIVALGDALGISLVVTLGERGVALRPRGARTVARVPAPPVKAVDTTGAGDAFVGAFAVGLATGRAARAAAILGCAAASASVTRPGTQRSYPDQDSARRMLGHPLRAIDRDRVAPDR